MTYIVVGFKVNSENSVHYSKVHSLEALFKSIQLAFEKGAEFISLRRVE
jgi:hypothetical protein